MEDEIIEQTSEEPNVNFIRLITGEDLIAENVFVDDGNEQYFLLMNPMKLVYYAHENKPGRIGVSMIQWVFPKISTRQEFMVYSKDVLTMSEPTPALLQYYYSTLELEKEDEAAISIPSGKVPSAQAQALDPLPEDDLGVSDEELEFIRETLMKASGGSKKRTLH